jgi:hypothetical protein
MKNEKWKRKWIFNLIRQIINLYISILTLLLTQANAGVTFAWEIGTQVPPFEQGFQIFFNIFF